ncbi:hypothetical protein [Sphingobium cupriresistens]|uniref:hypothetical protein n=1 Tax=Sphingobium cupriresistens TaxID=1132417 RepID=UPI001F5CBBF6|nr:hypothetical protein [Sphingobium cupriresistens]
MGERIFGIGRRRPGICVHEIVRHLEFHPLPTEVMHPKVPNRRQQCRIWQIPNWRSRRRDVLLHRGAHRDELDASDRVFRPRDGGRFDGTDQADGGDTQEKSTHDDLPILEPRKMDASRVHLVNPPRDTLTAGRTALARAKCG